jgi:hypothetical protein
MKAEAQPCKPQYENPGTKIQNINSKSERAVASRNAGWFNP